MMKRFFQRLQLRIAIFAIKTLNKEDWVITNPFEIMCLMNCRKSIRDPRSELLICPITKRRYIKNSNSGLFIVIHSKSVSIVNHTFHYPISLSTKGQEKLARVFDGNVGKRRQLMEAEIMKNTKIALEKVFNKV